VQARISRTAHYIGRPKNGTWAEARVRGSCAGRDQLDNPCAYEQGRAHIEGEDTQNRDYLAFVRTVLALERTVLAYVRTALAFAALGAVLAHFIPEAWPAVWMLAVLAGVTVGAAVYRCVRVARSLRNAEKDRSDR
jgi:putative membrane protein